MKKFFTILFSIAIISGLSLAQDTAQDLAPPSSGSNTNFVPGGGDPIWQPEGAVLFDNGPLVNDPGGGSGGADRSFIESALGHTLFGWGHQVLNDNSMADDFTIPAGEEWMIDELITWAYQTNAPTTSTITAVEVQIWDGDPSGAGTVIWGDMNTNLMTSTTWSNIYRTTDSDPSNTARAIMVQTSTIGTVLPAGTYWINWQSDGSLASGPWCPPVTELGVAITGDALQGLAGVFGPALNGTQPNGAPFVLMGQIVPVELTSFTASAHLSNVTLNWSTATETNNQGFEVQRSTDGNYIVVGFIDGHGTTTEIQNYTFIDENVQAGSYTYRLKQVDYDGTFEYSNEVSVEVGVPDVFELSQNYPNPFNPSTKITYSLAVDSKVTLSIFNVLGEQVATLINSEISAGNHELDFNAAGINSGVYFYRLDAQGNDGSNFSSTKKMILAK